MIEKLKWTAWLEHLFKSLYIYNMFWKHYRENLVWSDMKQEMDLMGVQKCI